MTQLKEYILHHTSISKLSVYDLLKHVDKSDFIDNKNFKNLVPISLEVNSAVFSKAGEFHDFPTVAVSQIADSIVSTCSCSDQSKKMCEHQVEVLHAIIEERNFRVFFDRQLRRSILQQYANQYGLQDEQNLDAYFQIYYENRALQIKHILNGLILMDKQAIKEKILPIQKPRVKQLAQQNPGKEMILVISNHRYYSQLSFLLMEAETTKSGKIKNPLDAIDPKSMIWNSENIDEIKFYTAIYNFQQKFTEDELDTDTLAVRHIVQNPLGLPIYLHDKELSENVLVKSVTPVELDFLKAEIKLNVYKKEPFFEITGELIVDEKSIPFSKLVLKHSYFVQLKNKLYFIDNPDLLRVINYFKQNNEILLLHASKYDDFFNEILSPLEQILQINYTYIKKATPAQIKEKDYSISKLIYLQQEGSYVSITPVIAYGEIEVPVYSRKQLFDKDQNGNVFKVARDFETEDQLVSTILNKHPDFLDQLREPQYFYLHKNKFLDEDWFMDTFEQWRTAGIAIMGFTELTNQRINPYKAKIQIEIISGMDWFNAKLKVGFGDQQATLQQIHRSIRHKSKFVQLDDGSQGIIPEEWIAKIVSYFNVGEIDGEFITIPKVRFSEVEDLFDKEVLSEELQAEINLLNTKFAEKFQIPRTTIPEGLNTALRSYQQQGVDWMNFLDEHNFGGCLADDMGLGKTVQVIAFLLKQKEKYPNQTSLIIVPTSLLFNWEEEIQKFAPSLKVAKHYGQDRQKDSKTFAKYDVLLSSYGMLLSDIRFLKDFTFNYVFLDESQAIKNPNSERYKAARLLKARNRMVLTGTPFENGTFDLYGQLSFAIPGLLGNKKYFKDTYATPIDQFEYGKRANELQQKIKPFILRRTKKQVATELPEKTEMLLYCEMDAVQRNIYDSYETELREFIAANEEEEIHKNSLHVLAGLTRLRQICNAPILLKEGHSGDNAVKIQVILEQIENKSPDHKILIFSQFVGMLDLLKPELEKRGIEFEYLTGQSKERGKSVKRFQTDPKVRVFLISLKAGGTGLNLTEADYVYLIDPWWNPAVENQAIDRSYRIGQTKHVVACKLICIDTIEEKIIKLQQKKSKLAQDIIQSDQSFFTNLSKSELLDLL